MIYKRKRDIKILGFRKEKIYKHLIDIYVYENY